MSFTNPPVWQAATPYQAGIDEVTVGGLVYLCTRSGNLRQLGALMADDVQRQRGRWRVLVGMRSERPRHLAAGPPVHGWPARYRRAVPEPGSGHRWGRALAVHHERHVGQLRARLVVLVCDHHRRLSDLGAGLLGGGET